jgi:hypothetical protein
MVANSNKVEFLRFGSSIPGGYWGCCAGDIIQAFKTDPDELASCQSVNGDGGYPQTDINDEFLYFGPTNRDLFMQRLRVGTFGTGDMANHFFLAVLTDWQLEEEIGQKWLAILKECGFEFIRTVANSVYTGSEISGPEGEGNSLNHVFGLFRGIAQGAPGDQYTPPEAWTALPQVKQETWQANEKSAREKATHDNAAIDIEIWNRIGEVKLLTEKELVEKGAPVTLAGLRSANPQELKAKRDALNAEKKVEVSLRTLPVASSPSPVAG